MGVARAKFTAVGVKKKDKRFPQAPGINLTWPFSRALTLFVASVIITVCIKSQTTTTACACELNTPRHFRASCSRPTLESTADHITRLFRMLAVAVGFHRAATWRASCSTRIVICIKATGIINMFFLGTAAILMSWLLLMSGDVERNPGPLHHRGPLRTILETEPDYSTFIGYSPAYSQAIHSAGDNQEPTLASSLPGKLMAMAGYDQHRDSNKEEGLEFWCQALQEDNDQLKQQVHRLSTVCYTLQEECKQLSEWKDMFLDFTQKMDGQVDRIESFSRRNNLRLFNVYEGPSENNLQCTRKVVQLLNRYFPIKEWTINDVERAHRLGPNSRDLEKPRTIIARLFHWQDKLAILTAHDCRRMMAEELNIRVASDLTNRQNQLIKEERVSGGHAYVWRGRLYQNGKTQGRNRHTYPKNGERNSPAARNSPSLNRMWITTEQHLHPGRSTEYAVPVPHGADTSTRQQRHLVNDTHDLPWTADMNAFPTLSKGTAGRRGSVQNAVTGSTGASSGTERLPNPQRLPRLKSQLTINRWGIRQPASPASNDGRHVVIDSSPEDNCLSTTPLTTDADQPEDSCLPTPPDPLKMDASHLEDSCLPTTPPDPLTTDASHPEDSCFPTTPPDPLPTDAGHPEDRCSPTTPRSPSIADAGQKVNRPTQMCTAAASSPTDISERQTDMSDAGAACPTKQKRPAKQKTVSQESPIPALESHPPETSSCAHYPPSQTFRSLSCTHPPPQSPRSPHSLSYSHAVPEVDCSQTFPKQLTEPWTTPGEAESQTPEHPTGPVGKRKTPSSTVTAEQQDYAVVSETPRIPSRLTRSRAKSRQQHVDECFPRVRVDSSRTPQPNERSQST